MFLKMISFLSRSVVLWVSVGRRGIEYCVCVCVCVLQHTVSN